MPASCLPSPKPAPRPAKVENQQLRYFLQKDKITSFDAFKPEPVAQQQQRQPSNSSISNSSISSISNNNVSNNNVSNNNVSNSSISNMMMLTLSSDENLDRYSYQQFMIFLKIFSGEFIFYIIVDSRTRPQCVDLILSKQISYS
ncbi:hypothetical protein FHG87_025056 [Trinorchestia longiramus]|nr:hypothetical protein FHG87_025056 [Trinorchestia longiramus]